MNPHIPHTFRMAVDAMGAAIGPAAGSEPVAHPDNLVSRLEAVHTSLVQAGDRLSASHNALGGAGRDRPVLDTSVGVVEDPVLLMLLRAIEDRTAAVLHDAQGLVRRLGV